LPGKNKKLNVTVVGAGSVGSTLAFLLKRRGHSIVSVISKTKKSARSLAARVGCHVASDDVSEISPKTSFLLIATPESAIDRVARSIAGVEGLPFKRIIVAHTSGALSSDVLSTLSLRGSQVFSFHPIQSFPKSRRVHFPYSSMKGVWYGFEGPGSARPFARRLAGTLGGKFLEVPKEKKILYHLTCVFASNYPVVLLGAVERLAGQVSDGDLAPFRKLFESSSENAFQLGGAKALTGPIARGSMGILHRHMVELGSKEPELLAIYSTLGLYALEILREKGTLSENDFRQMESILTGTDDR